MLNTRVLKMKTKNLTLLSGTEDSFYWAILFKTNEKEQIENRGAILLQDNKLRWKERQDYYLKHRKLYYERNREKVLEHNRQYRSEHPEIYLPMFRETNARRRRSLGFNPINKCFEDSEGHHITKDLVLFIPKELHKSISHNLETGKNMEEINKAAFEWLDFELARSGFDALST